MLINARHFAVYLGKKSGSFCQSNFSTRHLRTQNLLLFLSYLFFFNVYPNKSFHVASVIMSKLVWLFVVILPTVLACNMNMGAYKLHNGQGEMSYMDREKANLYSEQGVWVSWKVPVPRHWDPQTGRMRNENPGKKIGANWGHWNQLADENPPMKKPTPEETSAANVRVVAPDPYREYLRSHQKTSVPSDELFFLSAGMSPEHGTSIEAGVIKGQRPKIPAVYLSAMRRPSFNFQQTDEEEVTTAQPMSSQTTPSSEQTATMPVTEPATTPSNSPITGSGAGEVPLMETMAVVAAAAPKSSKVITIE